MMKGVMGQQNSFKWGAFDQVTAMYMQWYCVPGIPPPCKFAPPTNGKYKKCCEGPHLCLLMSRHK